MQANNTVAVYEAKTALSELLEMVEAREESITKDGAACRQAGAR